MNWIELKAISLGWGRKPQVAGSSFWGVGLALLILVGAIPQTTHGQIPTRVFDIQLADTLSLSIMGRVAGITWIGPDTLAVLDDISDTISANGRREVHLVFQDRVGQVMLEQDFTGVLDRGLAWDGEFLWGCGDSREGGSLLYKISLDSLMVTDAYDLPGHRPMGMCYDGRYIWLADRDSGRLDRFDAESGAITRSAVSPAFSPVGMAWDGRRTWLTDAGTGLMYQLTGGRRNWRGTVSAGSFFQRGKDIFLLDDGFSLFFVPNGEHFAIKVVFPR